MWRLFEGQHKDIFIGKLKAIGNTIKFFYLFNFLLKSSSGDLRFLLLITSMTFLTSLQDIHGLNNLHCLFDLYGLYNGLHDVCGPHDLCNHHNFLDLHSIYTGKLLSILITFGMDFWRWYNFKQPDFIIVDEDLALKGCLIAMTLWGRHLWVYCKAITSQ